MSLSPEARILADFLRDNPRTLAELLLDERRQAREPAPESPALSAVRALSPWTPDEDKSGALERVELAHGLLVAAVLPRSHLRRIRLRSPPRDAGSWVALVWDHHPLGEIEQLPAGTADTPEEACALADALLVAPERRWRLM